MQAIKLLGSAERQRAFEVRARAYRDLLGEGVGSYEDIYDPLPNIHLYGVYDDKNRMVASYRMCTDRLPLLDVCSLQPPTGSIELSRMSLDPSIKNPLKRTRVKIAAAKQMMKFAIGYGASHVYLMVRPGKGGFYERVLGFKSEGETDIPFPPASFNLELLSAPFDPLYEKYGGQLLK